MNDTRPLSDITVLDFTRVLSGPYATMLLNDIGAKVIKVEIPSGDDARNFAPFFKGESLYFAGFNRGKESITLNLKTDEGKDIVRRLVKENKVDVIVENYRPNTMERLGLGWEDLHSLNPRLIYAAASGFGHTGPESKLAAYDILAQARGGIMSITGWENTPPTRIGSSLGDITAGIFTALGVISALYQRQKTGLGQKVDVSMLDCQVALLENAVSRYQVEHKIPVPLGNAHPSLVPFQAFMADDKYFVLAIANDNLWQKLCTVINMPELALDDRFATVPQRDKNKDALIALISPVFLTKTADEWVAVMAQAGIPCSHISNIQDLFNDTQLAARNMLIELADTGIKLAGNPLKMTNLPEVHKYPAAPKIGEHTETVLQELLGLTLQDISELKEKGVI